MESIKPKTAYFDTTGLYDSTMHDTQAEINSDMKFVDALDIRFPFMYLRDVGYGAVQGLCCVGNRYIIVGRYRLGNTGAKDLMVFDIVTRKVIKSNIFYPEGAAGKNVELGHLSSITYVRANGTDYLYVPRKEQGDILRLTFDATTGDIVLDTTFSYSAPTPSGTSIPYKPLCLAYAGGDFYYIASTTKSNRCYIYKISNNFSTTELAFMTTFDGLSAGHFSRQGMTSDGKYLYFSLSGYFNKATQGSSDAQYGMRELQEIIITDLNGTVVKSLTFPRGEYGEIEDIDLITPVGSTAPSLVIACNQNDSVSHFAPVYACQLYRNSKKSFYLLTPDSEGSLIKDSGQYRVYCDSSPCYIDTSGNPTDNYNVLNSNPFATGLVQDKFTSIPAAIGYIKKLGVPVTLIISGKHGGMTYRGLRGINFVFDGTDTDGNAVNTEVADITLEDCYGISLTFKNGATHGTIDTGNSILYGGNLITDWRSGYIENTSSDVGTQISLVAHDSSVWVHTVIDCTEGDLFTISGFAGITNRFWCFLDVENHILDAAPPMAKYVHKLLVTPPSASKLVIQQALAEGQTAAMPNYRGLVPFVDSLTGLYENRKREVPLTWEQGNITTTVGYKSSTKHIRSKYGVTFNQGEKLIVTNHSMDYGIAVYGSKQNTFKLFQTAGVFVNGCGQIELDDWTYSYQVVMKDRENVDTSITSGQYVSAEIINNVYTANDVVNKSLVGFSRSYAYANPYLNFLRKTMQSDGTLVDSTTNVIVEIPNHGRVEVKSDAPVAGFKIAKVYNNAVTYLVEDWSYYTYRYVGDNHSKYYAIISNAADPQTAILPDDAAYYVGVYTFADEGKDVRPSALMGKHVAFIGDSITQGRFENYGSSVNNCVMKPFGSLIAEHIGDKDYGQFGIGGALVYDSDWKSLYRNCGKVTGYDVIFVCGGSNDFAMNITENNFRAAFDYVVTTLIANNSGSDIVVCSPIYSSSRAGKNSEDLYMYDYAIFEKEIAEAHNLKFIDMYTPTNNSRFVGYCSDGVHPNEMGHRLMADIILAKYDELSR